MVPLESLRSRLNSLIERYLSGWRAPEAVVLISTAILVGLGTGFGAVAFIWLLRLIRQFSEWVQLELGGVAGLLGTMLLAGILVGFVVERWALEAKGHGVPEVMEALVLHGGRIRPRVAALKVLASALTIGTGGSAGREGPIVQVGSALGSSLGQLLRFSNERVRTLVACGAAAGIAATFNAPIAGSIFALEVVLGRFTVRHFGAVVVSSVSASIIGRIYLGDRPAFNVPAYQLNHLGELSIYLVLGVLSALVAVLFIVVLYRLEGFFDSWELRLSVKAGIGMLLTGALSLLLAERQVLGPGLDLIGEAIAEDFSLPLGLMASLLILKLLATSLTLGSGNSGGVFAPSLFMGAVLGGMVGTLAQQVFPDLVLHPGGYAIVGMAAVFSGAARAPITAVLIVFEMSNDYRLILPLMLATVVSTLLAESIFSESIYTFKLRLKGIVLQSGRDVDILQAVTVDEVMTRELDTISADRSLSELSGILRSTRHHGLPVIDPEGGLWGVVTITDLDRATRTGVVQDATVAEFATPHHRLVLAYPDEPIGEVLTRMGARGLGRMPVVARDDPRRLLGMIRRHDIIRAYHLGLTRRAELQHRARLARLRNLDGTEFVEVELANGDWAVGKPLAELSGQLPHECVVVSVRRRGRVLIPHAETTFLSGDLITAFIKIEDIDHFSRCIHAGYQAKVDDEPSSD